MRRWMVAGAVALAVLFAGLVWLRYELIRAWSRDNPPLPPGLLIANESSQWIEEIRVTYPGGSYVIQDLAPGYPDPHSGGADWRHFDLTGNFTLVLEITYRDGRQFRRELEMAQIETLLRIYIQDKGHVHIH